ncbi:MAG: ankyrin repeat protein [Satyrvirus sp.]|uniref:Ankyrin repeat protein n=1 Tax=Satyrvirus sp. TaxID=2487771 RepID=A0A3G5AER7_9VIRU|nr:MAG: ankyrin repeat protein [Satyrvirus sp.]
MDNIIEWIFNKIFDQITINSSELYIVPFDKIKNRTFANIGICNLVNKLSNRPTTKISEYLLDEKFQENFLFSKIKKKINVQILLGNINKIKYLINFGYKIDERSLQLCIMNNRLDILKLVIDMFKPKLDNKLLSFCAEFGYDDIYFFLREKNLVPNISIFNSAVLGNSLNIIKDINKYIGISKKIVSNAFETDNTDIILYLVEEALNEKIKIEQNLIIYPIMNNNFSLLEKFEKMDLFSFSWHVELYYSAILSGSIKMAEYVETKINYPDMHKNRILDTSKTKKGYISPLLTDIIYEIDGKKYFSHCINYAIQSGSVEMLEYIYSKGYKITPSNFITALKQGTVEMLFFLSKNYETFLPFYFINYFGVNCYFPNKMEKAKILVDNNLLKISYDGKITINDYKKDSLHVEMINQSSQICEDSIYDIDYLMKYSIFFVPEQGYKLNNQLLSKVRLCLEFNLDEELRNILTKKLNEYDKQIVIDSIYLFGNISQIKKFYPLLDNEFVYVPNKQIIMEILCYGQLNKLCYLQNNKLINESLSKDLYTLSTAISDHYLNLFFKKFGKYDPELKFVILSKKKEEIEKLFEKLFEKSPHLVNNLPTNIIKNLLLLDDIDLIKNLDTKFGIKKFLCEDELINWMEENDLLEIREFIQKIEK